MRIETEFCKARVAGDVGFLRSLYATELRITGSDGSIIDRDTDISRFASGEIRPELIEPEDMRVSVYGEVAVMTAQERLKGTYKGVKNEGKLRVTHGFVRRDNRWQLVASQGTWVKDKQ